LYSVLTFSDDGQKINFTDVSPKSFSGDWLIIRYDTLYFHIILINQYITQP
jgi:hypothetical protein